MKGLFSLPEHKVFEYKPLFYDPEKERLEQRRKELGLDEDTSGLAGTGALLRSGAMRSQHSKFLQEREDGRRKQRVRTLVLVIILCVIFYLVYQGSLDSLVAFLMNSK